jgi:hypothetical protein
MRWPVESDIRFYRRRASEELAAAGRAVTQSARERRMILAGVFLERLKTLEAKGTTERIAADQIPAFNWSNGRSTNQS